MQGNIKYIITRLISGFYKKTEIQNKFKGFFFCQQKIVDINFPLWYSTFDFFVKGVKTMVMALKEKTFSLYHFLVGVNAIHGVC